jgi:hypothetical protein
MPGAHIAGMPVEEMLLAVGGPAALYAAAVTVAAGARRAVARLRSDAEKRPGVEG